MDGGMANNGMTPTAFENRLFQMRQKFVQTLPGRVAILADTLRECQQGVDGSFEALDRQFHALAGTAGTFGLSAIAVTAADGEEECGALDASAVEASDGRYLWSLIEELEHAAMDGFAFEPTMSTVFQSMNAA